MFIPKVAWTNTEASGRLEKKYNLHKLQENEDQYVRFIKIFPDRSVGKVVYFQFLDHLIG